MRICLRRVQPRAGHPRSRVAQRRRESPPRDPAEGERGPQEAGRAALIDEEALLPLRLELGLVVPETLEGEERPQVLVRLVDRALPQAGARTATDPRERGQAQTEPPISLLAQEQHQLAEEIVHEAVRRGAAVPHEVDCGHPRPYAGHLVHERGESSDVIPDDDQWPLLEVAAIESPDRQGPLTPPPHPNPFLRHLLRLVEAALRLRPEFAGYT